MNTKNHRLDDTLLAKLVPVGALPLELRTRITAAATLQEFHDGEWVFREGDTDDQTIYLVGGELRLSAGTKNTGTLKAGSDASRHPLSPMLPREISAQSSGDAKVLFINGSLLDTCLIWAQTAEEELAEGESDPSTGWIARLSCSGLFGHIPAPNIRRIFSLMQPVKVRKGDVIIQQGEEGDYYYIIQKGKCLVTRILPRHNREVRLAELTVGGSFGEEALISNSKRNATITMLTDGVLKRLTKEDFVELIKNPILQSLSREEADKLDRKKVVWLDVRLPDEFHRSGIEGSTNLPLAILRREASKLKRNKKYIIYCDSGRRSSAGAFLLAERGFDAFYLAGGIMNARQATLEAENGRDTTSPQADATASQLKVNLAQAEQYVTNALHRKANVDAIKHAMEAESAQLRDTDQDTDSNLILEVEEGLAKGRRKYEQEAERTEATLQAAQQTRLELESAARTAADIAAKERTAIDTTQAELRQEAEHKLREGEKSLSEEYAKRSEELEEHQRIQEQTKVNLETEHNHLETTVRLATTRLKEIEREQARALNETNKAQTRLREFDLLAKRKRKELVTRENQLRQEAGSRLSDKRIHLEAEFAHTLKLLEQFRREQEDAENARLAAEREAQRIEAETRAAEELLHKEAAAKIQEERERLEKEAQEIKHQLAMAQEIKAQAEAARRLAEETARKIQSGSRGKKSSKKKDTNLRAEIKNREKELAQAQMELESARKAQMKVSVSQNILEKTNAGRDIMEDTLRRRLKGELSQWVVAEGKREKVQEKETERILDDLRQIQERIEKDKRTDVNATNDMFDEIRSQLGEDD